MLTATQRRDRYAAQAGVADPDAYRLRPGPQARRAAHKTRRRGATPARLAASAARQDAAGQRAFRLDERARLFLGNALGKKRPGTSGPTLARPRPAVPRPAAPWADRGHDVAGDLRRTGDR